VNITFIEYVPINTEWDMKVLILLNLNQGFLKAQSLLTTQ